MILQIIPIRIGHEIQQGDDLVSAVLGSQPKPSIQDGDVFVFTQKIISKQEGRVVNLSEVKPTMLAIGIASEYGKDPRIVQLILDQSKRLVRMRNGIMICETYQGMICANAGVDESNVADGHATVLPNDADESAKMLLGKIRERTGKRIAVIISDTFGRPFRQGQTNVAIGVAGISPILDYAGTRDTFGKTLRVTAIAIADELCSAAELVMGKSSCVPVTIVRNFGFDDMKGTINHVLRSRSDDLFR